ncbi:uncharacterized protein LOC112043740 isoform X2 [Bicyclus anynana]|uniref:Uncharacterized protein LOC112043740 isoform X2 n=1 Tax=Bicyclus anynana TaxID=110368 RepID=A0A6J1MQ80_BICAN|nr:uncharacterized protein LOC112043740 isoform X2 [Bicyclus anynana]
MGQKASQHSIRYHFSTRAQGESPDSSQEQMNSFAGEPVSASFYYVPTKTYDSGEEPKPHKRSSYAEDVTAEYPVYGRRMSRHIPDYNDMPAYAHRPMPERRRSMYIEEPVYVPMVNPMVYESLYGPVPMPNPYIQPPRPRVSLQHQPDYVMANGYGKQRRQSRLTEAYEQYAYETLSPEYEDWARPMPKSVPDNFHLSRYGHLQIDYSCSWNSLDRIIRNQQ